MAVNYRKKYRLQNKTNYFNPVKSRTHVEFGSPLTYQARRIKIEGYETRLYWEFRYCDEHSGQTFFYTLTYNDKSIPKYEDQNCFDYEDLRYLLNGGFKKMLLRKYGTNFKYFVGAELGDGKGQRGMHNNPHYHVLFFLRPADNPRYPYKQISPEDFRYLVKTYWQGFDETRGDIRPYEDAKYGIAKEGENCGKVTDYRACVYCAKYVTKDVKLKKREKVISHELTWKYEPEVRYALETKERFLNEVLNPKYNIPTKAHLDEIHNDWLWSPTDLYKIYAPRHYEQWLKNIGDIDVPTSIVVMDIVDENLLHSAYSRFVHQLVNDKVNERIKEYRNRYCNKCRISQGVGDYALQFIDNPLDPIVEVPSKKGMKQRPLSMYYYRKLFTKVVKDPYGQPLRILNELGIDYKCSRLQQQLQKKVDATYAMLCSLTPALYNMVLNSDVNTEVNTGYTYDRFINDINNNKYQKIQDYANFKLVYEDRFFQVRPNGYYGGSSFPMLDVVADYRTFITPSYYEVDYSPNRLNNFIATDYEGYLPYYAHPYFLPNLRVFAMLDNITDYLFVQGDRKAQTEAEEVAEVKRFHSKEKVKDFYAAFGIY